MKGPTEENRELHGKKEASYTKEKKQKNRYTSVYTWIKLHVHLKQTRNIGIGNQLYSNIK